MTTSPLELAPTATIELKALIDALRDELQQYGEMLARLDTQQQLIMRRASDELADAVAQIEQHQGVLQRARQHREVCQQAASLAFLLPAGATFQELIPRLPEDYRPLVGALIQENNELLVRVQQRARQNHLMLFRTLELMKKLMHSLLPPTGSPGYNALGHETGYGMPSRTLYEAVG
jgi:hypothetical protein